MARRKKGKPISGWINLNKPVGMTSNQALGALKRLLNPQKAGHAGTLDPLASGILPIALGEATKTVPYVQDSLKTYRFTVTWGQQRTTDDAEGDIMAQSDARPTRADIEAILPGFIGDIEQIPPQFSAIKINGARAYDLARDGETVEIAARPVYISSLAILSPPIPPASGGEDAHASGGEPSTIFECVCGKGTYVRSLARDMGQKLGCFGYISQLERTAVGGMTLDNAISLDFLENLGDNAAQSDYLLPLTTALDDIPVLAVKEEEAARLKNGSALMFVSKPDQARLHQIGIDNSADDLILATYQGKAIAMLTLEGPEIRPVRIFNF